MKNSKFLRFATVLGFTMLFTNLAAQNVSFNSATALKKIDEKTVSVTMAVTDFASVSSANGTVSMMQSNTGITKAELVGYSNGSAQIVLTMPKSGHVSAVQNALVRAKIPVVKVDGKEIASVKLVETLKENRASKK